MGQPMTTSALSPQTSHPYRRPWPTLLSWATVMLVGLMIFALIVVKIFQVTPKVGSVPYYKAAPDIAQMASDVPSATFTAVAADPIPSQFSWFAIAGPALVATTPSGNRVPKVLVVMSENCTGCAAERWALLAALGRFGTFTNLGYTTSSATVAPPSLPSFSFREVHYHSRYLVLRAVELQGSFREGNGRYPVTGHLTRAEQRILVVHDQFAPSPVVAQPPGIARVPVLPFVDLGGRTAIVGSQIAPSMFLGETRIAIAASLSDPTAPTTVAIISAANEIVRSLCHLTGGQPATVCR